MKELKKLRELIESDDNLYVAEIADEASELLDAIDENTHHKESEYITYADVPDDVADELRDEGRKAALPFDNIDDEAKFNLFLKYTPHFKWSEMNFMFKMAWKRKRSRKPLNEDLLENPAP